MCDLIVSVLVGELSLSFDSSGTHPNLRTSRYVLQYWHWKMCFNEDMVKYQDVCIYIIFAA